MTGAYTFRRYTTAEDALMLQQSDEGVPNRLIAMEVGRGTDAVKKRLQFLRRAQGTNIVTAWPMEMIDTVRKMWAEGYSCSQIGAAIGKTRNAVIGKVHRLQLPGRVMRGQPTAEIAAKVTAKPPPSKPRNAVYKPSLPKSAGVVPRKAPKPVLEAPMGPGVPLVYVTGCKYAVANATDGTHLFCNAPSHEKSPWCEYHYGVCYQKHNPDKAHKALVKRFKIPTSLLRVA